MKRLKFIIPCTVALLAGCTNNPQTSSQGTSQGTQESSATSQQTSSTTQQTTTQESQGTSTTEQSQDSSTTEQSQGTSQTTDTSKPDPVAVSSVSFNKNTLTLKEGEEEQLVATILPENATDQSLVYDSSDKTVATVEDGLVKALKAGTALITATAHNGVNATCELTVEEAPLEYTISQLNAPSIVSKRASRISTLDKVESIRTNKDPNRKSYYENEEGGADLYRVGTNNAFNFNVTASAVDEETLEETTISDPFLVISAQVKGQSGYEDVEDIEDYMSYEGGKLQLTENAIGETFKVSFNADDKKYTTVESKPITFEFEAIDAYNVYDAKELAVFDNRTSKGAAAGLSDPWADIKEELNLTDVTPKSIVLQDDINITNEDLPASYFYTEAEIENYATANPDDLQGWIEKKNAAHADQDPLTTATAKAKLAGSMRDYVTVYERVTSPEDDFILDGNYFTLDTSALSKIYAIDESIEQAKLNAYQDEDGSHAQLFGFNTKSNNRMELEQVKNLGGSNLLRNMTVIGNGGRSSDDDDMGGLITYKVDATQGHFKNVVTSKTFITFYSEKWINEDVNMGQFHIDRCKSFDSYNSMFYVWGSSGNTVSNTFMKGAGGAIFLLDEVWASERTHWLHGTPSVDSDNVYYENYVDGLEPWFVYNKASSLVQAMVATGASTGWLGANATLANGNTIMKVIDNVPHVSIIAVDMCGHAPLGNTIAEGDALKGHFTITNGEESVIDTDLAEFNRVDEQDPTSNPYTVYSQALESESLGMVFGNTVEGGHGFTIKNDFSEGATFNPTKAQQIAAALGGNIPAELAPSLQQGIVPVVAVGNAMQKSVLPELTLSEYLSTYLKAASGTHFLGVTLGANPINA